jgi:hypothetical protein
MSADAAHRQAELRHAQTIGAPGALNIDGTRIAARISTERGLKYLELGGSNQLRKLSAIVLCSVLPKDRVLTASGDTRPLKITHIETGTEYRIDPSGVDLSPYGIYWHIEASQATAQK